MAELIDSARIRRAFNAAAATYRQNDFLYAEVRERLAARLHDIALAPARILDAGAGAASIGPLAKRFPSANVVRIDSAIKLLRKSSGEGADILCADVQQLPLKDDSVDIVFANLLLPFCADPAVCLGELGRVLRFPGALVISTFGPDTLRELTAAWRSVDQHQHVLPFIDMHDLGDLLVSAGFTEPVLATESLTIKYRSLEQAANELRGAGSINAGHGRPRGLTSPRAWQRVCQAYDARRDKEHKLPATFELVFSLAWASDPKTSSARDGVVEISPERISRRRRTL